MPVCAEKIYLMETAQEVLLRLSELTQRERDAIATASEGTLLAIDREIELAFGEKERTMGAFQQHRREHGC